MLTKSTAVAHSNTALIKYWGKKDEELIIPLNNSISVTIDSLTTTTTVDFLEELEEDIFILDDKIQSNDARKRVINHLDIVREIAKTSLKAKVVSKNNFPIATGLASSASGFAALTVAASISLGLRLSPKELSVISRRGSGSSCRSIFGGFVEWLVEDDQGKSYALQLADENWFDIRDIALILDSSPRKISTREAMKISTKTSPFVNARINFIKSELEILRKAIRDRDFQTIGEIAERDCLAMHSIAFTSNPPMVFWMPETIKIIHTVEELREQNLSVYYTIDTGANMHLLTVPEDERAVLSHLKQYDFIKQIIVGKPGEGVKLISNHLF